MMRCRASDFFEAKVLFCQGLGADHVRTVQRARVRCEPSCSVTERTTGIVVFLLMTVRGDPG